MFELKTLNVKAGQQTDTDTDDRHWAMSTNSTMSKQTMNIFPFGGIRKHNEPKIVNIVSFPLTNFKCKIR